MAADLERYFPQPLQVKYREEIGKHRLRREIIATVTTNSMINRAGIAFIHEVQEKTGMEACDVARGYAIARTVFANRDLWAEIEALDTKAPAAVQSEMVAETGRLIERVTTWFLRNGSQPLDIAANIAAYGPGVQQIVDDLDKVLTPFYRDYVRDRTEALVAKGAPHTLARRVADMRLLVAACDIVKIAGEVKTTVDRAAHLYFAIGDRFGIGWLRRNAHTLPIDSHWDKQATTAIIDDLYGHQYELTASILRSAKRGADPAKAIESWRAGRGAALPATMQLIDEIRHGGTVDLAMLAVVNRHLRALTVG